MPDAIPLANVQNIGPKSADALARAGLTTLSQLQQMGAVAAYVKVKGANTNITLNMLWALEGAISGLPWQVVANEHRTSLLLALEEYERRLPLP
ncbi:TfoX/Sxy family protein [Acidovorax delafieldii]|uniref:TfoX/Sxy family protein n=1 Tax=Acidovorax delafieldii TaxID=47920 RepID=UPI003F4F690E